MREALWLRSWTPGEASLWSTLTPLRPKLRDFAVGWPYLRGVFKRRVRFLSCSKLRMTISLGTWPFSSLRWLMMGAPFVAQRSKASQTLHTRLHSAWHRMVGSPARVFLDER